ncbi:mavicyanin-like isoform X4 [Vigna unguiculata]|uniref:mavicyanin-like isoform X4 n=1 Tax=Vigna unguiculata TaxID=3917 RepID=UPI0010168431|nr:mavicyanin-like isoform X4 [Vigna unguiculata]
MANVEILFLLLTLKLMSLPYITEGEEHVVGGNSGWIIPVNNPSLYSSFAASTTFRKHYESCNVTDIMELFDMSPAKITLNRAGDFYFACAFPSHCSLGQKLSIHVTAGGSSSLTPSEAPLPPPPHSRAPTLLAVTVPVLVMAVATNLLFHCY